MDITLNDQLNVLQQINQRKFLELLVRIPGTKDLIIEQKLMKILDSFVGVTLLKQYGVDKIYKLEQELKPTKSQRLFLISSSCTALKRVFDQLNSEITPSDAVSALWHTYTVRHHLLVTPFMPAIFHHLLEEDGLALCVGLWTFRLEFIKLDGSILSLEYPMFTDLIYSKSLSLLAALPRCLWSLLLVLGLPRLTVSLGKHSQQILTNLESMKQCHGSSNKENGALIIMDRNYDLVTTLLTPVTYAGLLHEVLEVNVGVGVCGKSQTKLDPDKDHIYSEIRDMPCSEVFPILHKKAKSLKAEQDAIRSMGVAEMGKYVATKLQKTRDATDQVAFHINACQAITDKLGCDFQNLQTIEKYILECKERKECISYIERSIDDYPSRSLRLLCLLSITGDGITPNEYKSIQKRHLHMHGYGDIPLFYKLGKTGLLKSKVVENLLHKLPNWNSKWSSNAQRLKLLPKQADQKGRTCPSYVFNNAYIPLIAQILSIVSNQEKDPRNLDDLANLPSCVISGHRGSLSPKMVVICVVGGITCAEISACRLVEKSTGIRLVLASDSIITGNKIIEAIHRV